MTWLAVGFYLWLGTLCVNTRMLDIAFENESPNLGEVVMFVVMKIITWPWWAFRK